MSTVNFSVPENVKEAFNRTFEGQNKSAIIADLMRKAVEDANRQTRRKDAFRLLAAGREHRPTMTDDEFRKIREEMRD